MQDVLGWAVDKALDAIWSHWLAGGALGAGEDAERPPEGQEEGKREGKGMQGGRWGGGLGSADALLG